MFQVINQPYDGTLESELLDYISQNNDIESIFILSAYAKVSGVSKISSHFRNLLQQGCQIDVCVGIDQRNTSSDALQELLNCTSNLYVYHNENLTVTTHPKVYYLKTSESNILFIGSNNLTGGGLETNDEVFTKSSDLSEEVLDRITSIYNRYTDINSDFCIEIDVTLVNELLENNYILTEGQLNTQLRRTGSERNRSNSNTLFGSESRRSTTRTNTESQQQATIEPLELTPTNSNNDDTPIEDNSDVFIAEQDILDLLDEIESYDSIYENGYETFVDVYTGTKSYYHIPQGVHLGHLFYIVKSIGDLSHSPLDYRLTVFNESTTGGNGSLIRQTRYKIALAMELLLINDIRLHDPEQGDFTWSLTNNGQILYDLLNTYVVDTETFYNFETNNPSSWKMSHPKEYYKNFISDLPSDVKEVFLALFNNLQLFERSVNCLNNLPDNHVEISYFYNELWTEQSILDLLDLLELGVPSLSSLQHRIPFLVDLLESFGIIIPITGTNSYSITR